MFKRQTDLDIMGFIFKDKKAKLTVKNGQLN